MSSDTPATTVQAEPAPSAADRRSTTPRPRDGNVAIREEFANAVVRGEVAALEMFIRRHPDHALAEIAQIILARGLYGPPPPGTRA